MDMSKDKQSKLYLILMEDVCHMYKPIVMSTTYKLAMENLLILRTNFPNVRFCIMLWDFYDVDSLSNKCMDNLTSLL